MSRMFKLWQDKEIATVNPFNGCRFDCKYCWAEKMAKRQQGKGVKGYENGFEPSWCPERMEVPKDADVVFVGSMGDIAWQKTRHVKKIINEMIKPNPETAFLLESKEPANFTRYLRALPPNVILSTTIETNRPYEGISKANVPYQRFITFRDLYEPKETVFKDPNPNLPNKHVSIEPVMDFDLSKMVDMVKEINPEVGVSLGYDNYNSGLPEPEPEKFYKLADELSHFTFVEFKTRPEDLDRELMEEVGV